MDFRSRYFSKWNLDYGTFVKEFAYFMKGNLNFDTLTGLLRFSGFRNFDITFIVLTVNRNEWKYVEEVI